MTTQEMQKRSEFIKAVKSGECEIVEIGNLFGDCYVIGERKNEAAKWLREHTTPIMCEDIDIESILEKTKTCEQLFDVTVDTLY